MKSERKNMTIIIMLLLAAISLVIFSGCSNESIDVAEMNNDPPVSVKTEETNTDSLEEIDSREDIQENMPPANAEQPPQDIVPKEGRPSREEDEEGMPPGGQDRPPREDQGVPEEAIDACSSLSEGDSCSFSTPRGDMSGTCSYDQGTLACGP